MPNIRWCIAGLFLLLSIGVDFSSKLLSIVADGLLIGVAVFILLPLIKPKVK
ncbi:MAG: DUF3927 family protein [Aeromonas veronii]